MTAAGANRARGTCALSRRAGRGGSRGSVPAVPAPHPPADLRPDNGGECGGERDFAGGSPRVGDRPRDFLHLVEHGRGAKGQILPHRVEFVIPQFLPHSQHEEMNGKVEFL